MNYGIGMRVIVDEQWRGTVVGTSAVELPEFADSGTDGREWLFIHPEEHYVVSQYLLVLPDIQDLDLYGVQAIQLWRAQAETRYTYRWHRYYNNVVSIDGDF